MGFPWCRPKIQGWHYCHG